MLKATPTSAVFMNTIVDENFAGGSLQEVSSDSSPSRGSNVDAQL
jgi:hypothetical protein